jgi:hypothetical protein
VLPLLEGTTPAVADEDVIFACEDVDVAMNSAGQRFVACAHPTHGHAPRYAELVKRMAAIGCRSIGKQQACVLCGGGGWLPINGASAHQQYALMRAIGYFRGLPLPQLVREARVRRVDGDTSDSAMPGMQ